MDLGLTRKAAAAILRTSDDSLKGWEEGRHLAVLPSHFPRIIAFLTYNPLPEPTRPGEAIRRQRLTRGWSIEKLAREAGVDPATVRRMEEDRPRLGAPSRRAVYEKLSLRFPPCRA
jgi:DNA-binding transcriptional regulator YiaG